VDSTQQLWAAVLTSAGLFSFLGVIATGITKHVNGTAGRERLRNMGMKEQRNEAWAESAKSDARADREAQNRRLTEEYASGLRRDLLELGVPEEKLRKWPELKKAPPEKEQ
jgi:hypothetical protein